MIKKRNGEIITTNQTQNKVLSMLYDTFGGRIILKFLIIPSFSKTVGTFMDSPFSIPLIKSFIKKHNLDTSDYIMKHFRSYNDFFTRKITPEKLPFD